MASRAFTQFRYSLEKMVVDLYVKITFGSTGAPTLTYGKGISSVTRNSAGDYTITLQDNYQKLLMAGATFLDASAPASPAMYVKADNSASGTVEIVFNSAGTATDPGNGEVVLLQLTLSNSSAL